jgi:hypothetical protein
MYSYINDRYLRYGEGAARLKRDRQATAREVIKGHHFELKGPPVRIKGHPLS